MESVIAKLNPAAVNGSLEIAPALANFNFDFALYKVEAPQEFRAVGVALSPFRREAAENGMPHITARKLGALFERIIPSTPKLVKAYGKRASEISQSASIDPKGRRTYGAFTNHVGADATSIWAAATSGSSAIAVHLLGCMLARMWEGPEATSIWVEIVDARKKEILEDFNQGNAADIASLAASNQIITREQLAEWDASARAWLRVADIHKMVQQKQLVLVLDNISRTNVNNKPATYGSVITAWSASLVQMESLIEGLAQVAQEGAILLALSSWHLYPNMMVVKPVAQHVIQNDPIFSSGGILTIGLETSQQEKGGVSWSLPLAHLRHYGAPVVSQSSIESTERSRITPRELLQATLGCVFQGWGVAGSDTARVITWLSRMHDSLLALSKNGHQHARYLVGEEVEGSWFLLLLQAAKYHDQASGNDLRIAKRLITVGRKHGKAFLSLPSSPMFGLTQRGAFTALIKNQDDKIHFLRNIVTEAAAKMRMGISSHITYDNIFIRYKRVIPCESGDKVFFEYASALPWPTEATKRSSDGTERLSQRHCRWLYAGGQLVSTSDLQYFERLSRVYGHFASEAIPAEFFEWYNQQGLSLRNCKRYRDYLNAQEQKIAARQFEEGQALYNTLGEDVFVREEQVIEDFAPGEMGLYWKSYKSKGSCLWERRNPWFKFLYGDIDTAALFIVEGEENILQVARDPEADTRDLFSLSETKSFDDKVLATKLFWSMKTLDMESDPHLISLRAISTVACLYKSFPNASFDVRILQRPLFQAHWIPTLSGLLREPSLSATGVPEALLPYRLSRASAFACIAMFESGQYNSRPGELEDAMALSSGDSIYVAAAILCDPLDVADPGAIIQIPGNIGRPGMAFLVPPKEPLTREVTLSDWPQLSNDDFDGKLVDSFSNTSLHLSFTGASSEVNTGFSGGQDVQVYMLETLISIHECGRWMADLDIMRVVHSLSVRRMSTCSSAHDSSEVYSYENDCGKLKSKYTLSCIDNWLTLLDGPEDHINLVRAHGNWQARLAAVALSISLGYESAVLPRSICWGCFDKMVSDYYWRTSQPFIVIG